MTTKSYTDQDMSDVSDNPEWTLDELRSAKPFTEAFPDLAASLGPAPSVLEVKTLVSLRLSRDVVERFEADGPGWQSRIDDTLRKAVGL